MVAVCWTRFDPPPPPPAACGVFCAQTRLGPPVLLGLDALEAWFQAICARWNRVDPADPCADYTLCANAATYGKSQYGWAVASWP